MRIEGWTLGDCDEGVGDDYEPHNRKCLSWIIDRFLSD